MEKQTKSTKLKFLRFLPKATAITFQNLPFSPTKANSSKLMLPGLIIPAEARLRPNKSLAHEPTSPKISCMGQIKHKKCVAKLEKVKKEKEKSASMPKVSKYIEIAQLKVESIKGRHVSNGGDKPAGRKSDAGLSEQAPSLSQMRRFASGRECNSIASFDWTTHISPMNSNENEGFSVPIVVNGVVLEPKKEINLWKRRPMNRPKPLKIE